MGKSIRISCVCCKFEQIYYIGKNKDVLGRTKEILEEIKLGTHGKHMKQFQLEHPGAVLETERTLYQCETCNELIEAQCMTLTDVEQSYEKIYSCSRCYIPMIEVTNIKNIKCPVCASPTMILEEK